MARQWERVQARSAIYEYLSAAFLYPGADTIDTVRDSGQAVASLLAWLYSGEGSAHVLGFLTSIAPLTLEGTQEAYTEALGHIVSTDCPPYEGEYGQAHIFNKSQSLADLGAFFSAFGLEVAPDLKERLDHISVELEFMHVLTMKEAHALREAHGKEKVELCRQAQRTFVKEHLGYWACSFAGRLAQAAEGSPYGYLARALDAFVRGEAEALGTPVGPQQPVIPETRVDEDPACYSCSMATGSELEGNVP